MKFLSFYELILDLLQGIKTNVLTSALIYVYDISALKSVAILRTAITEFLLNESEILS